MILVALLPWISLALYDKSDDVHELTASNFDSMVLSSEHVWVVEFYAPWLVDGRREREREREGVGRKE